jgi:hypothetical protein
MKNLKLIGFLMILVSSLMFIQCTSDPIEGPQGIAGVDGYEGVDGLDGASGTASCVACHSNSHRETIETAYTKSEHAKGATVVSAGGRGSCSRCHSSEGYVNYVTGKPAVDIVNASAIGCTTCHSKHSTFDFANDGHDFALRNMAPTKLDLTDNTVTISYGNSSNSCVSCHQGRSKAPVDNGTGLYLQTNTRFYPHYSGQVNMLEGIQGAFIAGGTTAYPGVGTAAHRTGASCVSCHMKTSTDGLTGGHTFEPNLTSCTPCHTSVPTAVAGLATDMADLKAKLIALGLITVDGTPIAQTKTIPFKTAQALWNYGTVYADGSKGVHNPTYAKALIKNALEAVQ